MHQNNSKNPTVTAFIHSMLQKAIAKRVSDIHIEPQTKNSRLRFRIDGILHVIEHIGIFFSKQVITAIKIMAKLDIAEQRLPQDGRFNFPNLDTEYDIRVATCPTIRGEKLVLRILNSETCCLDIAQLGMLTTQQQMLLNSLNHQHGMILVTGPTGSGKTTTLYSILTHLNKNEKNICSVEDPVEIKLDGINQVAIQNKINLSFAATLRAFLRQDPDIIMLGEIRDNETAKIAIKAAQTGHLVLATLHTNSAIETITRLLNMDISAYDIASSINIIIAQRLVRKLCSHHSANTPCTCSKCYNGFLGRSGIFEVLPISKEIAKILICEQHAFNILSVAKQQGFQTLQESAKTKVKNNISTWSEIKKAV